MRLPERVSNSRKYIVKVGGIVVTSWHIASCKEATLPSLLSCEPLVEQNQDFGHVELNILEI